MGHREYIVSIEHGQRVRSVVWDTRKPLPLQLPARWVLCETPKGLRIIEQLPDNGRRLSVPPAATTGKLINIPASRGLRTFGLRIRPFRLPAPVYVKSKNAMSQVWETPASEVIFCGVGESLLAHHHVGSSFKIHVDGGLVFAHRRVGDDHEITAESLGVAMHFPGYAPRAVRPGVPEYFSSSEWERGVLRWNNHWWRIASIPDPKGLADNIELEVADKIDTSGFGRYAGIAGFLLTVALLLSPSVDRTQVPKPKVVTEIQLKAPRIVQALPTPVPKPKPKPEIKKEPPKVAVKKPEPPKPKPAAVKPQVAKIAKENKAARPAKAQPAPKLAAAPKPRPAAPRPPVRVAERPAAPAPHPIERNVPSKPVARATVPSLSPEQVAAKQAAQDAARAKAQLAQSLQFLSTSPNLPAAAMEADLIAEDANQKQQAKFRGGTVSSAITKTEGTYLSSLSSQGSAEGRRIVTRSARRISADEDTAYGNGQPVGSGPVRGKVATSALGSGDGSGVALGAGLGGGLDVSGSGEVAEIDIEKALEKSLARFQYCYEKVLLSDASLAGTILMEWTIDQSGKGSSVKVVRSQLNNNPLHNCLSSELSRVQFPSPKGGAVIVKYPFAFSSGTL